MRPDHPLLFSPATTRPAAAAAASNTIAASSSFATSAPHRQTPRVAQPLAA